MKILFTDEGCKIPASEFTHDMHQQAMTEGWLLSERDDGYLEIQRYDGDEQGRFSTDEQAVAYVAKCARGGSYTHQLAMHLDGTLVEVK